MIRGSRRVRDSMMTGMNPDRHDGEGRQGALLELIERGQHEDRRGQGLEVEGAQDQRGRQFLHAVDEDKQCGRDQRRTQQRQVDFEEGGDRPAPQRSRRSREVGRDLFQSALDGAE